MNPRVARMVAVASLLGCVAGAWGRVLPVHREYTQSIVFYDERGQREDWSGSAPDLAALQSLRSLKAQEGLLGKETLLDMSFRSGGQVFGNSSKSAGGAMPFRDVEESRGKREKQGDNWLVQSLSLPGIGQVSSNAALSAMNADGRESGWGWLADEVAVAAESPDEGMPMEDESGEYLSEFDARQAAESYPGEKVPLRQEETGERRSGDLVSPSDLATRSEGRAPESGKTSSAGSGSGVQPQAMAMPSMPRTREMLSQLPGFSKTAERSVSVEGTDRAVAGTPRTAEVIGLGHYFASRAPSSFAPGMQARQSGSFSAGGGKMAGIDRPSWQGGWNAQGGAGLSSTKYEVPPAPEPAARSVPLLPAKGTPGSRF